MATNNYSEHYGTYETNDGITIEIVPNIIEDRYKKRKEPRNIYLRNGVYSIVKTINGNTVYFGKYGTLESAIRAKKYFETKGWKNCIHEKDKFSEITEENKPYFESRRLY